MRRGIGIWIGAGVVCEKGDMVSGKGIGVEG